MDSDGLGVLMQLHATLFSGFLMKFISFQKICHRTEYIFSFCGNQYIQIHSMYFYVPQLHVSATSATSGCAES